MNDCDFSNHDYIDDDFEENDEDAIDCAMGPDGQCGKAGSEECDWDCPIMASIIRSEAKKKVKK